MPSLPSTVREVVAHLLGISEEELTEMTPLNGPLASSVGRARLDAALRRHLGRTVPACYTAKLFGELEGANGNGLASTGKSTSVHSLQAQLGPAVGGVLALGFDLQSADELPVCSDYWSHEFYSEHFTPGEIAAGLLREDPREHYAGIWCAKEALKKADAELLLRPWREIEIRSDAEGRPAAYIQNGAEWQRLPHAISISHTGVLAGAVAAKP